jgi:hypothetical protein
MLLLPIIRDISIRPVHVYTRLTPETSLTSKKEYLNYDDRSDPAALLYYDIRVKLIRCPTDAPPPRQKKISNSPSSDRSSSSPELEKSPISSEPESKEVNIIESTPLATTVPVQQPPTTSTLYSIGALIGSLYYGANSSASTVPTPSPPVKEDQYEVCAPPLAILLTFISL